MIVTAIATWTVKMRRCMHAAHVSRVHVHVRLFEDLGIHVLKPTYFNY